LAKSKEPFVVMAKPVGSACNLECSYCYYLRTGQNHEHSQSFKMPESLLEEYVRQYIEASPGPTVSFVWHGGEPTLAGLDFYRRAVEFQKRYLPPGWTCWNNLQTNGTLLNEDWCSFLAEARFDVGLSIDGVPWVHDVYRKDRTGRNTYELAVAAVRRLQAHGVQPDLLCTVTSTAANEPVSVYRALRDLKTGWIQFIPIVRRGPDGAVTPDSVSGEGYGSFLKAVFDEWVYHDLGTLNVQLFAEMQLVWGGGAASACWMAPVCGRVLILEHDGNVYSCDHFVTAEHLIGRIGESPLGDLVDSETQRRFGEDKRDKLPAQCRSCRWLTVCQGNCPKDRFAVAEDGAPGLNYLCRGLKSFFAHAEGPLRKVMRGRSSGQRPDAIMARLRAELAERWKGVGRNDLCPCGSGLKAKHCCWEHRP
jgi:uncharacterized protein